MRNRELFGTGSGTFFRRGIGPALLLCLAAAWADPVQIEHGGLRLNAEIETAGVSPEDGLPIFLIVHGTWAHHGMEIIRALQSILAENGYPSLAITLSLGIDDRRGALGCDAPVVARHDAAVGEIGIWLQKLKADGWSVVVLAGHSRGGAQAALFQERRADPSVQRLLLLGPMVWRPEAVAADYDASSPKPLEDVLAEAQAAAAAEADGSKPGTDHDLIGPYPLLYCKRVAAAPATFLSYYGEAVPKHTPAIAGRLDTPADIYLGTADDVSRWSAEDRAAVAGRPGVTVHNVEGADHFFRDLYLYDVVEDFLDRLP